MPNPTPGAGPGFLLKHSQRQAEAISAGCTLTNLRFSLPLVANSTLPVTSANSVWSLPMPTLVPG